MSKPIIMTTKKHSAHGTANGTLESTPVVLLSKLTEVTRLTQTMRRTSKRLVKLVTVIVTFGLMLYLFKSNWNKNIRRSQTVQKSTLQEVQSMKTILFWTPFRDAKDYTFGFGQEPFKRAKCKVQQCQTTSNRSALDVADAVVFHITDFAKNLHDIPKVRHPRNSYVFFHRESPVHTSLKLPNYNNFFNVTMTYSKDADVMFPYGFFERREEPYEPYTDKDLNGKTKFAIAIIGHCPTQSKRMKVIEALSKYVQIDVVGGCGHNTLNASAKACFASFDKDCIQNHLLEYRYYLAFENSLCEDYITEKMYKVMNMPLIPVVYGGANYAGRVPPNSVINVRDFHTAEALASLLKEVAANSEKYLSYFAWRKTLKQGAANNLYLNKKKWHCLDVEPKAFCNLCEFLHSSSNKPKVIKDLQAFWGEPGNCFSPEKWLTNFVSH